MQLERGADLVPGGLAAEDEIVQPGEQPKRQIPREIRGDVVDPRIHREPATKVCVERRAGVAERGLPPEDLGLTVYSPSAALA